MVHLVIPPLYRVSSKSDTKKKLFVRDDNSLLNIKIDYLFKRHFELRVSGSESKELISLNDELFTACVYIIYEIGKLFELVSSLTLVPAEILERLTNSYDYLKDPKKYSKEIQIALNVNKLEFNELTNSIIISVGNNDVIINLTGVLEELENKVIPLKESIHFDKFKFYLTTLNNLKLFNKTPLPISTLYKIFEKTNDFFYIERLKGLGSMKPEEVRQFCLDPDTRITYPIYEIGDLDTIINLLGDDPQKRKDLLLNMNIFN
jgi:DNA gyrase/topoisomerase IV subunit B